MLTLVIATRNVHKVGEIRAILGDGFRYLTLDGKLPLFRVNTMGYGKDNPAADNKTRDGRKQNRRVEVKLFTPDLGS